MSNTAASDNVMGNIVAIDDTKLLIILVNKKKTFQFEVICHNASLLYAKISRQLSSIQWRSL